MFADKTQEGTPKSPVTDTAPDQKPVTARYVRLVITGAVDLPPTADGADLVNAENGLSIFEIKVYGEDYADDLERIFEAESYHNVYGMEIEKTNTSGLNLFSTNNNDYILYQDVDLGDGVDTFVAKVASNIEEGRLEIHLDSLESEPVGVLNVGNTGGDQSWDVLSAALNADAKGFHEKVYLVYKGNPLTENLFQIDWFKFGEAILDKTPLRDTIAEAKDKVEGRYEKAGLELLKEALAEAIATLENPDALQAELYAAQEKLQQAIDNLQYRGGILAEYYTVPAAAEGSERGDSYDGELLEDNKKETVKEDNINYATMEDLLMQHTGQNDNAGVRWSGRLVVPETGEYTFSTYTDNGVRLYIDGQLVIAWWMNDWEQNQYSAPIHLEKGQICEFTFEFMELTGGSCAKWYWSVDGSTREIVPYDVLTLPKADYQELQDYLQKIPERKEEDYTPESWKAYEKALEQAREAVKDELAFQEDLDGAKAALEAAEKGLQKAEKEEPGETPDTPQTPETPDTSNPSQKPDESQKPGADSEAPKDEETAKVPAKGQIIRKGNVKYQVTKSKAAGGAVTVKGIVKKNVSSVKVPKTVTLNGYRFTVTKISKNAFKNCKKIKRVSIGDGVTTVEQGAFQNCTALAKITLGKNVKTIGKNAFRGDKKLKSIVMKSKKLKRVQKNALKNIHKKAVIQIPKSRKKAYAKLLSRKGSSVKLKYLRQSVSGSSLAEHRLLPFLHPYNEAACIAIPPETAYTKRHRKESREKGKGDGKKYGKGAACFYPKKSKLLSRNGKCEEEVGIQRFYSAAGGRNVGVEKRRKLLCDQKPLLSDCIPDSAGSVSRLSDYGQPYGFPFLENKKRSGVKGRGAVCEAECGKVRRHD